MKLQTMAMLGMCVAALVAVGCSQDGTASSSGPSAEGAKFLLNRAPGGALEVMAAKASAKDDDEVIVVGRIGGKVDPWVSGLAAFDLADNSLRACNDIPGDECETPWDYCCDPNVDKGRVQVQVVDDSGKVVKADARKLLGVKELDTIVVRGTAKVDEAGNLTVLATGIFVKKS